MNMKFKTPLLLLLAALASCGSDKSDLVRDNFTFAGTQLKQAFVEMDLVRSSELPEKQALRDKLNQGPLASPRNIESDGTLHMVVSRDWTSGFFPGELWYMYEYTGDDFWKDKARQQTALIEREKLNGGTHDMGFKVYCSFGNGYRLTGDANYKEVLLQSAYTIGTSTSTLCIFDPVLCSNKKPLSLPAVVRKFFDRLFSIVFAFLGIQSQRRFFIL